MGLVKSFCESGQDYSYVLWELEGISQKCLWQWEELVKLSAGADGISQGCLRERVGLVKLYAGIGVIFQTLCGKDWSDILWECVRLVNIFAGVGEIGQTFCASCWD